MLAVAVLLGLVALRWGLLLGGVLLLVPRVRACPACLSETLPVRRPWLRRLLPWLEWRWCPGCGWEGPGRRKDSDLVPAPGRRPSRSTDAGGPRLRS